MSRPNPESFLKKLVFYYDSSKGLKKLKKISLDDIILSKIIRIFHHIFLALVGRPILLYQIYYMILKMLNNWMIFISFISKIR